MRKPVKTAALLFGLGVGVCVGPSLGPAALWSGVAVAALGVGLSLLGTSEADLVEADLVDRVAANDDTAVERLRELYQRPTLSGLGPRVEQILRLAEGQAKEHRAEVQLECEQMLAAARQEAETIVSQARDRAAGITGNTREHESGPSA
ncbi:hypothetical protein AB0B85_00620 [Micromonospora sp. NPDC049044]|uniref:hypothetical protein n=1 Tax=Micromonospora sp. NPDC049044 TaxID=3154827 RepID=UPI0033F483B8